VIEGIGRTKVGGENLTWKRGDTFCIPSWYEYQHFADSPSTAYLYRFDDRPMVTALGYYRAEEVEEVEDLKSLI
jgi:gentisate 1,2-dioxygenase